MSLLPLPKYCFVSAFLVKVFNEGYLMNGGAYNEHHHILNATLELMSLVGNITIEKVTLKGLV